MNPIIQRGEKVNFTCIRCGKCCSSGPNVALTVQDVCKIAKYMNTSWRDLAGKHFYAVIADHIPVAVLRGIGDKCIFLKIQGRLATCTIYPARPMRCRLYPFIPVSPGEIGRLEISTKCPGVKSGEPVEPPWSDLEEYSKQVREHYTKLFDMIFNRNLEPLRALEGLLNDICTDTR
ncbi:MAG: YkgJ family cysteine cluster protein [Desulfurococcaceae archaeon]